MAHRPRVPESMRRTRSALAAVLVAFVLVAPASRPIAAWAGPGHGSAAGTPAVLTPACGKGYWYAEQITGTTTAISHDCDWPGQVYEGWIGIDGQITTPASAPQISPGDHAAGWLGMISFDHPAPNEVESWIQIGWLAGNSSDCTGNPAGGYEMYVEYDTSDSGGAQCFLLGSLSLGSSVTYRIEFDSNGCWEAYYDYNVLATLACGLPNSMAAAAVNEFYNYYAPSDTMPRSVFGSTDPDTDAALRLRGATGWQPWDTTLEAGGTLQIDKRSCPCYYISSYQEFYHELTY